jgi:hypothetical protein
MKTKMTLLLVTLLLTIAAFGQTPSPGCNLRSAMGAYGYSCSGAFQGQPFAAYGYVFSDGKGQWHGYGKVSLNGTILPWTHGTRANDPATVNPDCTGSVTYEVTVGGQPAPDAHFDYVIVDNGGEVKGFPTDQGYAVSCQLIREK